MKLLLILPPSIYPITPPLGISLLKTYLSSCYSNLTVKNIDLNIFFSRYLVKKVESELSKHENSTIKDFLAAHRVMQKKGLESFTLKSYGNAGVFFCSYWNRELKKLNQALNEYILNTHPAPDELIPFFKIIEKENADLIGFSVIFSSQFYFTIGLAKWSREILGIPTIIGGAAMRDLPFINQKPYNSFFDHVVEGEGEVPLTHIIDSYIGRRRIFRTDYHPLNNGNQIDGNNIMNLNSLPSPDYDDLPFNEYLSPAIVLSAITSRGCGWGKCSFCSHHHSYGALRFKSASSVVNELQEMNEKYGIYHFDMVDEFLPPKQLESLSEEIINRRLHVKFSFLGRPVKAYTDTILNKAYRAGARFIFWGVESGSQRVLNLMKKGTKVDDIEGVLKRSYQAGIRNCIYTFTGFPGETGKDRQQTMSFIERIQAYLFVVHTGRFSLQLGSHVHKHPEKYGIEILEPDNIRPSHAASVPYRYINGVDIAALTREQDRYDQFCREINGDNEYYGRMRRHLLLAYE